MAEIFSGVWHNRIVNTKHNEDTVIRQECLFDIYNLKIRRKIEWKCDYNSQGSSTIESSNLQIARKKQSTVPTLRWNQQLLKKFVAGTVQVS